MNNKEEILSWLQLINTDKVGPITFSKLLKQDGTAAQALKALSYIRPICPREWAEKELKKAKNLGAEIIIKTDSRYPQKLLQIEDAPPVLYVKGNIDLLEYSPSLAIVGARNASINGRKLAAKIAYDLTEQNVLIISGMAKGIDAAAHKGSMHAKNQTGATVAILGTGIDQIYPCENTALYNKIVEQGLLISEFSIASQAHIGNFPRRNRIVSALSDGVLVVEATDSSGSLITAKQAQLQKKMLFAIPGSPNEARASGPNHLLREGANWVESAQDILPLLTRGKSEKTLPVSTKPNTKLFTKPLDILQKTVDIPSIIKSDTLSVLDFLSYEATAVDEIIRSSGIDVASVAMQLIDLEMEDKIIRTPGNKVALKIKKVKEKR